MKKYTVTRKSPTTGIIFQLMEDGKSVALTGEEKYGWCLDWVFAHQRELKVYKVARILYRKNGRRRFVKSFYTENQDEAIRLFDHLEDIVPDATYQLFTGDWKIIAHFMVVNGQRGQTIID